MLLKMYLVFKTGYRKIVSGSIVDLSIGNTEMITKMIQKITGSDMSHIEQVKAYSEDYTVINKMYRVSSCTITQLLPYVEYPGILNAISCLNEVGLA